MLEEEGKRRDGGRPEEGRTQDGRQIHGCDLDQIDLTVGDGRAVKHGLKTRTQLTASFTQVVFAHHNIYTHTRLPTRTNPQACIFTCVTYSRPACSRQTWNTPHVAGYICVHMHMDISRHVKTYTDMQKHIDIHREI